jgi:tetratricopeptide (TPR) repeat protein
MKAYLWLLRYRLWIGIATILAAVAVNVTAGFWPSFILYFTGLILIAGHFFIGPMRLIQQHVEEGDVEGAKKVLDMIWFPNLLYKPIRSAYYSIKGQMAMMTQGANKLQLGMLAMQRGDLKQGESYIRAAIRLGIPDKDGAAMAYLQMCSIYLNKREFRAAKDFFRKAKAQKATNAEVVSQIKQLEKYISRVPG